MLKFLLGFLLVANLALLASNAGILGTAATDGHEPNRAAAQLNAQRIVLIDPAPGGAGVKSGAAGDAAAVPQLPPPVTPAQAAAASAGAGTGTGTGNAGASAGAAVLASNDPAAQCIEIGNFDATEAARFEPLVAALAPGDQITRRSVQEVERYIVYIPPQADKEAADRKAAELKRLGIEDFFIFNDSSDLRYGISLGIFKTAEGANQHLATLTRKGVRSAKIAARVGAASKTAFQLRGLDPQGQAALTRIQASFPKQETRSCAAL